MHLLESARRRRGFTFDTLATASQIGRRTLFAIWAGEHVPHVATATRLAAALRLSTRDVLHTCVDLAC